MGTIAIAASNVTLDLNCHLINGNGAPAAITTTGFNDITIKNGAVTNPGSLGISVVNTRGFIANDIQVYGSDRALALIGSSNSEINIFKAYNNTNTFVSAGVGSAVILVDNSTDINFNDVQANNNIKALTASVSFTDPGIGILTVNNSANVTLTNVTTNSNSRTNNNSRFAPLVALFSKSVKFINSESNDNVITVADSSGFAPIHVRSCLDTVIDGCQADRNQLPVSTDLFFRAIYVADSPRNVITNSQANDNFAQLLGVVEFPLEFVGIRLLVTTGQNDTVISNCQVSGNRVADGGSGRTGFAFGNLFGIHIDADINPGLENRTAVESCQVSDNQMLSDSDKQFVAGMFLVVGIDITVSNCSVDGNRGGEEVYGILVSSGVSGEAINSRNVRILNSTANDNISRNYSAGILLAGDSSTDVKSSVENVEVIGCQVNRNNTTGGPPFGIALQNARGCSIIDCEMDRNPNGFYSGVKTGLFSDPTQISTANSVINCSVKEGVNGFVLDTTSNNNFLFEGNVALNNAGVGFYHAPATLTSTYLSNFARDNGTNYFINGGIIQLHTLDLSTGVYANTSGDPRLTKLTNIQAVRP